LIGATIAKNDVGFGTIVGSAVFNVLFVIGLCGYAAKEAIPLTWWPLFRDCTFYIISLLILAIFCWDFKVELYEAIVLFILYVIYCVIMYYNEKIEKKVEENVKRFKESKVHPENDADEAEAVKPKRIVRSMSSLAREGRRNSDAKNSKEQPGSSRSSLRSAGVASNTDMQVESFSREGPQEDQNQSLQSTELTQADQESIEEASFKVSVKTLSGSIIEVSVRGTDTAEHVKEKVAQAEGVASTEEQRLIFDGTDLEDGQTMEEVGVKEGASLQMEDDDSSLMDMPDDTCGKVIWGLCLPIYAPLHFLLPEPSPRCFIATFVLSLLWIAAFSYFLVWWVTIVFIDVIGIPLTIMAFTLLAGGTSIPDAVSSVTVARQGQGDMAVSSSIGSNIFDILVGLPIPWIIKIVLVETIIEEKKDSFITIQSPYIAFYVVLLLFMVAMVVISIHLLGWVLNRQLGLAMTILYGLFLVTVLFVEMAWEDITS